MNEWHRSTKERVEGLERGAHALARAVLNWTHRVILDVRFRLRVDGGTDTIGGRPAIEGLVCAQGAIPWQKRIESMHQMHGRQIHV
eukprot:1157710-Pelagomonas_calceolata.AAC.2